MSRLIWIVLIDRAAKEVGIVEDRAKKQDNSSAEHSDLFTMQTGAQKAYALTDGGPKVTLPWRLCYLPQVFIVSLITC